MADDTPIMTFHIKIDKELISDFSAPNGGLTIIPFTGGVESKLFTGTILPGAADVQTADPSGSRHMCAKYMFRGKDQDGKDCCLFVENNGDFVPGQAVDGVVRTSPQFITDSVVLDEYLSKRTFRAEVHPSEIGVDIKVFDAGE